MEKKTGVTLLLVITAGLLMAASPTSLQCAAAWTAGLCLMPLVLWVVAVIFPDLFPGV